MPDAHAIQDYLAGAPRHARVIGSPASGKTTLLVERWRALRARGHHPGIVAFGREHRDRLIERILSPGEAYLGANPVTTHALVASAVLDAAHPRRPRTLRDVDELLVLGRLLRREPELLASDYAAISGSTTFLRDLLEAMHALAQNGLSSEVARASATRTNQRARDVLTVYARHREVCAERGLVSFYDAAWRAAEAFEKGGVASPLSEFDVVLIDDFHDLDPGQYHLLTRLAPPGGKTKLEVFGDPTGARFGFRGTSDRFFQANFPKDYASVDIPIAAPDCRDAALRDTVARLVADTSPTPPPATATAPATKDADLPLFASAPTPAASAAPETLIARPTCACDTMALYAADEIAEAQAVAARARAAIDAGTPPRDIAVIVRDAQRYRAVVEIACHEWGVPLDAGGEENGATADFLRTLLGALGSDSDGRFAEALAASPLFPPLSGGLETDTLVRNLERDYAPRSSLDVEQLIHARIAPLFAQDDTASHAAVAAIIDEWHRYQEVVDHAGGGVSIDEFRATYLAERGERANRGNRVTLLSAREATGRSFHTVFVCGCAEGVFPGATARESYIPLAALAHALEKENPGAARDIAARIDPAAIERAENALFLTALTRGTDTLVITTPARINGEAATPSQALGLKTRGFVTEEATRTQSPCARASSAVARAQRDENLAARLRARDVQAGWWVTSAPEARYPAQPDFRMSASKLGSYTRCARQFFYREILDIEEDESIYLQVGSLVHDALKEIIAPGATGDEVRAALQHAGTREIAQRLVTDAFKDAGAWMRELSVKYLEGMLRDVAGLESQRQGNYRVRMVEEAVEADIEGMHIRGRFDRVDDVDGVGPMIIDYKTSAKGKIRKTFPSLVENLDSDYWQIPVYGAVSEVNGLHAAAFVFYALPPGEESFAVGVQLKPGTRPAPIPTGKRPHIRYGPVDTVAIADAMAHAVQIHRSIVEGETEYERTEDLGICPNCYFARICQRSKASL